MSDTLADLMRMVEPRCEVIRSGRRCRRDGLRRVVVTRGSARMVANVCDLCLPIFRAHAETNGANVEVTR